MLIANFVIFFIFYVENDQKTLPGRSPKKTKKNVLDPHTLKANQKWSKNEGKKNAAAVAIATATAAARSGAAAIASAIISENDWKAIRKR